MANTANSTLQTNFNVTPYYDDYDKSKGYYRILFKPGFAVQARELTQIQTILQKQVDRFGKHVFREGSIVIPGQFNIEKDVDYIKIKDVDNSSNTVNVSLFLNKQITGLTNNVSAYVIEVADGSESSANTKTLYVRYTSSSSSNSDIKVYGNSEVLSTNTGLTAVALSSGATGKGSRFVISEGVIFAKEHFIGFDDQSILLSRYNTNPTCRVGFNVIERIVKYTEDASLLDPALEASNYSAPGADRLKLDLELDIKDITDTTGEPNFVELFTIQDGVITEIYDRSQYNILRDEIAKRTYDESGDYYVNGLTVRIREHLDNGVNGGYLTANNGGNTGLLAVGVEPGVAYVKGYEVGKLVTDYITISKANTYANISSQIATATSGNFIRANQVTGYIAVDQGNALDLYDTAQQKIKNKLGSSGTPTGNKIGTAIALSIDYYDGVLGTETGEIAIYLTDIRMNGSNSFANVKAVYTSGFHADTVLEDGQAVLKDKGTATLLYSVGSRAIRTLRDSSGSPDMAFNFNRTVTGQAITAGSMTITSGGIPGETFPYGTAPSLSSADKTDIIVSLSADINVNSGLTTSDGGGTNVLTGSSGVNRFNVGDKLQLSGNSSIYRVNSVDSTTQLTLDINLPSNVSGNTIWKVYKAGDIIDLNSKGVAAGATRTVSANSSTLSIDFNESFTTTATVTYEMVRSGTSAQEVAKTLTSNVYVTASFAAANSYPLTGPINLGISDIYQVRKIVKKSGSLPSSLSDGTDVTANFTIDNGQRDQYYDHGSITPKDITLTSNDYLLIQLDYFEPNFTSGRGYFSVDSYPTGTIGYENIPIFVSPTTKARYDLREFIDFRPVKAKTAAAAVTAADATLNPAESSSFTYEANGLRLPVPSSQFNYDYSYFLPRRDVIVMDKNGAISSITGTPGPNPLTPAIPENVMALASIYVTPYPSIAPNYAQILGRKDLSTVIKKLSNIRFTMRDIGVLKNRIVNLEYYASLTALEKSAVDMQIIDEVGLNRFKNGIFVDTFRDHSLGDTFDPNYRIVVDSEEKSIRPIYNMFSNYYDLKSNTNLVVSGDLLHLPYANTVLIEQSKVTSYRNVELSSYRFIGELFLTPDIDVWVDTQQLADNQVVVGSDAEGLTDGTVTEWNQWQTQIVGYKLYKKSTGELLGTFSAEQKDLAYNNAYWLARNVEFNKNTLGLTGSKFESVVETVYESSRTGTETFTAINEDTEQLGNKIVNVSIQPYIRPQILAGHVRGMKALTKLFVFFDGEDMNDYVTPLTKAEYDAYILNRTYSQVYSKAEGADFITDSTGEGYFLLRLPSGDSKRFRVGQKEVVVIDSMTNSESDATTVAKGYFVAQGLTQQKQNTILTTRTVITLEKELTETELNTTQFVQPLRPSCSAYSFLPKAPDGEEGIFLTKVDLYFQQKHPTLGFWIEIREMDSGGNITRNQVPLSEVWVESSDSRYVVSNDASLPTSIQFPAPVFLYNNVQYALVIHTIGLNPDTYIWVSKLGEKDIITGEKVTQRPLTGTFYTTNNNLNWKIVPDVDLKVTFYRAAFTTNQEGTAFIGQKPVERLVLTAPTGSFSVYGETVVGNQKLTLSGGTLSTANTGNDWLIGSTSRANAKIISYSGGVAAVANISFTVGELVWKYYGANGVNSAQYSTVTSIAAGGGRVEKYKTAANTFILDVSSSNGDFYVGDTVRGLTSNVIATVAAIPNFRYSVIDFEPAYLKFNNTSLGFEMKSTSNALVQGSHVTIDDNENYFYAEEQAVLSRSNEKASISGAPSSNAKIKMLTTSEYVSPVVDLARTHSVFVDNIINANTYQESYTGITVQLDTFLANTSNILSHPTTYANSTVISRTSNTVTITVPPTDYAVGDMLRVYEADGTTSRGNANVVSIITDYKRNSGGALYNRYISRPVVLAEGQEAEDILVVLTAYRPPNTDVKIWMKLLSSTDGDSLSDVAWFELEKVDDSPYSSIADRNDFREFSFKFPASMMTGVGGAVQYKNSQGITFTGFQAFAIKIGLTATNSAVVPRVADLRAIALQM